MREEFQQRRGYDLLPFLPVMTGRIVGSLEISERFLWDLRRTVSDLVIENYAGHMHELANAAGMRFTVEAYGSPCDAIAYGGRSDEPMGEFWTPSGAIETCRGMASAGHVYGKRIIGAEAFTSADRERWLEHPAILKSHGDRAFCEGINRFVFHRYAMQPWTGSEKGRSGLYSSTKSLGSISLKNGKNESIDARPGFEGEKSNQDIFPPQSRPDLPFSEPSTGSGWENFHQEDVTITYNDSGKYEDRWVYLMPQTDRCVFIEPQRLICVPIAHGEGKIVTKDDAALQRLKDEDLIAYKYVDEKGEEGPFPINPNGSIESIAGLTDRTGRVLGLMPHPERYVRRTQHPHWSRLGEDLDPDGIKIFRNAVKYVRDNLLQSCPT
jgi:hypothetical protein